jgi:hypothetical protein
MAWIDCMRLRRVATTVRAVGWTVSGLMFGFAATTTFMLESGDHHGLAVFAVLTITSIAILGVAYAIAWAVDRRGDRLVTR